MKISEIDRINIDREISKRSLSQFTKMSWPQLEPGQPYVHGWHMDAMGEHLQAVADGEITRLLINIPPGTSKSTMTSVMFPSWLWGPRGKPEARIISASHELGLATRDTRKTRILITSEWYQKRWPLSFVNDQNEKTYFENEKTGFRQCCPVASMTGRRGDFIIWDDPHSPEKAYSDADREKVLRIFSETLPTRLNNPDRSGIIIVMQRLHEEDVSGYILSNDLGYDHLCLPMEYEGQRKCFTRIGWSDPREEEGELLFPDRFSKEVVNRDKIAMGEFASAGQFQQSPVPRSGGLFNVEAINIVESSPNNDMMFCRAWDLAGTDGSGAYTVGALCALNSKTKDFYIIDVYREQKGPSGVRNMIKSTAELDGKDVYISLPQDPGQAGKAQAKSLVSMLSGYRVNVEIQSGSKETRAEPFASQVGSGNVYCIKGEWNKDLINELRFFPRGKYKDQVDAISSAFNYLSSKKPSNWLC